MNKEELKNTALNFFREKEYNNAKKLYVELLEKFPEGLNDGYKTERNIYNNLIVCNYNLLSENKQKREKEIESIFKYLEKYLNLAQSEKIGELTKKWNSPILFELFETIIDIILIKYELESKDNGYSMREDLKKHIISFLDTFKMEINKELFFDSILKKIYKEKRNYRRVGESNQNIKNAKILSEVFISLLLPFENEDVVKKYIANTYIIQADLTYYYDDVSFKKHEKEKKSIKFLENAQKYNPSIYARDRIKQLNDIIIADEQLSMFRHDMVIKISTFKLNFENLLKNDKSEKEKERIIRENISKIDYLLSLFGVIQRDKPTYKTYTASNLKNIFDGNIFEMLNITLDSDRREFKTDINFLKVVFENLLNNSLDAYKRQGISKKEERVIDIKIKVKENIIEFRDQAGGVKKSFLENQKLFDVYTSEKAVAQSHGFGLSIVRTTIENIFKGNIEVDNYEKNNKKGAKFIIRGVFKKRRRV